MHRKNTQVRREAGVDGEIRRDKEGKIYPQPKAPTSLNLGKKNNFR